MGSSLIFVSGSFVGEMIHTLYILNSSSGNILVEKASRGFLSRTIVDWFYKEAQSYKSVREIPPVLQHDKYVLTNVQASDLIVVCVVDDEMPALMALDLSFRSLEIFKNYFGSKLDAEVIRKNLLVVYQ